MGRVIDFRVTLPVEEYESGPVGEAGDSEYLGNYNRVYTRERGAESIDAMVAAMDAAGVELAVMQAEWGFGDYRKMNDAVFRAYARHPGRFIPYVTVNPGTDDDLAAAVEREVRERGARGVNLQPFAYRLRCNDKRFYALYAKCRELAIPVTVHCSVNFSSDRSIDFGRPIYLDEVACDSPGLTLVANHGGWPWVTELVAIAWKHPTVYIEIGAISPRYIAKPGTGWEPLLVYGQSLIQDRVLWATDCMLPFERSLAEARELPIKPEALEKWLGTNAARLLGV
ncbi:MAG: amidohydrolase family protein [Chloroflexota bacterium]